MRTTTATAHRPPPRYASALPRDYIRPGLLGRLNHEWATAWADQPVPTHWPPLTAAHTCQGLLTDTTTATPSRADAILLALLRLHRDGDHRAGRVVLQVMLGSAGRLVHTAERRELDDPASAAVEAMWATIATYPLHRHHAVPANLALNALAALPRSAPVPIPTLNPHQDPNPSTGHPATPLPGLDGGIAAQIDEATSLLRWAHRHHVLDQPETTLLARTYLADPSPTSTALARRYGVPPATLRKRQSRAVAKLAAAVTSRLNAPRSS